MLCAVRIEATAYHVDVAVRARDADALLQARHAEHHRSRCIQSSRRRKLRRRNEHVGADEVAVARRGGDVERRRHHADDRQRRSVQDHRLSDCRVVAVEAPLPRLMRDHDHRLHGARRALLVGEQAAALRRQPERVEERAGHERADEPLRLVDAREVHALRKPQRHRLERVALLLNLLELLVRQQPARKRRRLSEHRHETVGVRVRQRPQEHGVDDAEHGGVGADAKGERKDGDEREGRTPPPEPKRIANVLHHLVPDVT